jgi:hypothetical protein
MLNGMETTFNQLSSSEPKDVVAETFYNRLQNHKTIVFRPETVK